MGTVSLHGLRPCRFLTRPHRDGNWTALCVDPDDPSGTAHWVSPPLPDQAAAEQAKQQHAKTCPIDRAKTKQRLERRHREPGDKPAFDEDGRMYDALRVLRQVHEVVEQRQAALEAAVADRARRLLDAIADHSEKTIAEVLGLEVAKARALVRKARALEKEWEVVERERAASAATGDSEAAGVPDAPERGGNVDGAGVAVGDGDGEADTAGS